MPELPGPPLETLTASGHLERLQEELPEGTAATVEYRAWLIPEGIATEDGRFMLPGSLSWREPPLPVMASDRNLPGHLNAGLVANLVAPFERVDAGGTSWVVSRLVWDSDPEALEFKRMVDCALDDGDCVQMRGISVDLAVMDADVRDEEEEPDEDLPAPTERAQEWPDGVWLRVREGIIVGATIVPMPAFADARIEPMLTASATPFGDLPLSERARPWDAAAADRRLRSWAGGPDPDDMDWGRYRRAFFWYDSENPEAFGSYKLPFADVVDGTLTAVWNGVTAATAAMRGARGGVDIPSSDRAGVQSHQCRYYAKARRVYDDDDISCPHEAESLTAAAYPVAPPAEWFAMPDHDGLVPWTVTPEGRVYGHFAPRRSCHTGLRSCTYMPEDADFSKFLTGTVLTAEGTEIPVGQVVVAGGHHEDYDPDGRLRRVEALNRAYADPDWAGADVTVGLDEWGSWAAGAVRPNATPEMVRVLRASPLSGHWRYEDEAGVGPNYLIGIPCVSNQGFPVPRPGLAASATIRDGVEVERFTHGPAPEPPPELELASPAQIMLDLLASARPVPFDRIRAAMTSAAEDLAAEYRPESLEAAVWALVDSLNGALEFGRGEYRRFQAQRRASTSLSKIPENLPD